MGIYAEYLRDWILMDSNCKPRKLPPAVVLSTLQAEHGRGRITAEEMLELMEIGDADRAVNASGGAS